MNDWYSYSDCYKGVVCIRHNCCINEHELDNMYRNDDEFIYNPLGNLNSGRSPGERSSFEAT